MEKEIWKLLNFNDLYEVSNFGNVRNSSTKINRKFRKNQKGYYRLNLSVKNEKYKIKDYLVHRLVAEHFCEMKIGCNIINHKDGNKNNNYYKNLEWCTHKQNLIHAVETNLKRYEHQLGARKISDSDLLVLREILKNKPLKRSNNDEFSFLTIASKFNVCWQTIQSIWNGKSYLFLESSFEGSETIPQGSRLK